MLEAKKQRRHTTYSDEMKSRKKKLKRMKKMKKMKVEGR